MGDLVLNTLSHTFSGFFEALALFLPRLLSMLVMIAVGFVVAIFFKALVRRIFGIEQFRKYCDSAGITQMMRKAALPPPDIFLGQLIFWVIWLVFIVLGINALEISALQDQISMFLLFFLVSSAT